MISEPLRNPLSLFDVKGKVAHHHRRLGRFRPRLRASRWARSAAS